MKNQRRNETYATLNDKCNTATTMIWLLPKTMYAETAVLPVKSIHSEHCGGAYNERNLVRITVKKRSGNVHRGTAGRRNVCKLISRGPTGQELARGLKREEEFRWSRKVEFHGERSPGPRNRQIRISTQHGPSVTRSETRDLEGSGTASVTKTIQPSSTCSRSQTQQTVEIGLVREVVFARCAQRMQRTRSVLLTARRQFSRSNCSPQGRPRWKR